ncbi:hypothetical protein [Streptomyces goshikiensis]|uniref:hypothetical protein n=1 Tax=Streptomyces goshikiensis TaxID=1942 RepID=UPI00367F834C
MIANGGRRFPSPLAAAMAVRFEVTPPTVEQIEPMARVMPPCMALGEYRSGI